jgi:hypothetical protein
MKIIAPAALAALQRGDAIVTGAVEVACDPAVRIWGGWHDITFDGRTFEGIGDRGLVQVTGGALGDAAQNITLRLSGIEPETLALLEAAEVSGASAVLWRLIFDQTGSYDAAFLNGIAWNLLNLAIVGWLYRRLRSNKPPSVA